MSLKNCVACRSCAHLNEEKLCTLGKTCGADKPDDCWQYQNRMTNSVLATHSAADSTRQF